VQSLKGLDFLRRLIQHSRAGLTLSRSFGAEFGMEPLIAPSNLGSAFAALSNNSAIIGEAVNLATPVEIVAGKTRRPYQKSL
jgi:hypothetical protein